MTVFRDLARRYVDGSLSADRYVARFIGEYLDLDTTPEGEEWEAIAAHYDDTNLYTDAPWLVRDASLVGDRELKRRARDLLAVLDRHSSSG